MKIFKTNREIDKSLVRPIAKEGGGREGREKGKGRREGKREKFPRTEGNELPSHKPNITHENIPTSKHIAMISKHWEQRS